MTDLFRYAAFISYSSADARFAAKLHRALEQYRIPKSLGQFDIIGGGGKPNRVYPVFRDREELPAGELGSGIEAALRASKALIVVASARGAASAWVAREIEYFLSLGRRDKIFVIIPDNEPLTRDGIDHTQSLLPAPLAAIEPIAADARKTRDGVRGAWLKLVAGIAGISPGQLADRDARARRVRAARRGGLAVLAALTIVFAGVQFTSQAYRHDVVTLLERANAAVEARDFESARLLALAASGRPPAPWIARYAPSRRECVFEASSDAECILRLAGVPESAFQLFEAPNTEDVVDFSIDGAHLLLSNRSTESEMLEISSGTRRTVGAGHRAIGAIECNRPAGCWIVQHGDAMLEVFTADALQLVTTLTNTGATLASIRISDDRRRLGVLWSDGRVLIWNGASRAAEFDRIVPGLAPQRDVPLRIRSLAFDFTREAVVVSDAERVTLINYATGAVQALSPPAVDGRAIFAPRYSDVAGNSTLIQFNFNHTALTTLNPAAPVAEIVPGDDFCHYGDLVDEYCVAFDAFIIPDRAVIMSFGNAHVMSWDLSSGEINRDFVLPVSQGVTGIQRNSARTQFVTWAFDGSFWLFDAATLRPITVYRIRNDNYAKTVAISLVGDQFAIGAETDFVALIRPRDYVAESMETLRQQQCEIAIRESRLSTCPRTIHTAALLARPIRQTAPRSDDYVD